MSEPNYSRHDDDNHDPREFAFDGENDELFIEMKCGHDGNPDESSKDGLCVNCADDREAVIMAGEEIGRS